MKPVTESIRPFGVELVEVKHDGVFVPCLESIDVIEIRRNLFRTAFDQIEGVKHIVGHELPLAHHTGFFGEHHPVAKMYYQSEWRFPLPGFSEFTAKRCCWQIGFRDKPVFASFANALIEICRKKLLANHAGVVIDLPRPVNGIPRQGRQRHYDRADVERTTISWFFAYWLVTH